MHIAFLYPRFERHAQSNPSLLEFVPANEYMGSPSLGIASIAACTPAEHTQSFHDDRVSPVDAAFPEADLYAISFFTAAAERAFALADALRAQGKTVVAGGIFPSMMPEDTAQHFDAVVIGEGERVWPTLLQDFAKGQLAPRYEDGVGSLDELPPPLVDLYMDAEKVVIDDYPLQLSRGCPLNCNACALPGVMGKRTRFFPEDTVWTTLMAFSARGKRCNLTEDTSFLPMPAMRRRFRSLLQRIADHRAEYGDEKPVSISYVGTSMPLLLNLDPTFFDLLKRAGVFRFYLVGGFDPVTIGAFGPGDPEQLERAERCVKLCYDHGIEPYVSFLVGNDTDDEGTFDRMLEFSNRSKIRIAEFAIATPYPGTPVWHKLVAEDRLLHRRWTKYNDANVVFRPKNMSPERLHEGYLYLWREFYRSRQDLKDADYELRTVQF